MNNSYLEGRKELQAEKNLSSAQSNNVHFYALLQSRYILRYYLCKIGPTTQTTCNILAKMNTAYNIFKKVLE